MTTYNDDLSDRIARLGPLIVEQGVETDIGADPTGVYPLFENWYTTSIPRVSYGAEYTRLNISEGEPIASMPTRNRATVTASGHTLEMDDTPGNERIILKHNTGNGVEVRPDGSMIIAAGNQTISVTRNQTIVIEGNANIIYGGNVDMQVAGDYNLSVAGNYNLSVGENRNENTDGSYRSTTEGNQGHIIKGNLSNTTLGTSTNTVLGDNNISTKGAARYVSEGDMRVASGGNSTITANGNLFQSSTNMNIASGDISVFGSSGTIGGSGVVVYGKGATFGEGVTAPTFHGDLDGTAALSVQADVTNSQNYADPDPGGGVGSTVGYTVTNTATPTTAEPTEEVLNNYLNNTPFGATAVQIDIGNHFLNALNRSEATNGLSTRDLSTSEIRALLRTEGVRNFTSFIGDAVASGRISASYARTDPPAIRRVTGATQEPYRGNNQAGSSMPGLDARFLAPDDLTDYNFTTPFIINDNTEISRATELSNNVLMSTFLGGSGQRGRLSQISVSKRAQIARNLQPNAELVRRLRTNRESEFRDHRLVVVEGIYQPTQQEISASGWQESINRYRSEGRAVVYELRLNDVIDVEKTFDLAVYLKTVTSFEKMILDYDTYNTDGSLNTQLIFITPKLDENYDPSEGTWSKSVETRYNGNIMSNSDIIEFNEETQTRNQPMTGPR